VKKEPFYLSLLLWIQRGIPQKRKKGGGGEGSQDLGTATIFHCHDDKAGEEYDIGANCLSAACMNIDGEREGKKEREWT